MDKFNKGFTLIEIMIVVVIIAVMSTIIVLNVTAPSYSRFAGEVGKLASTLSILSDEAIYTNSVISCDIKSNNISCQKYKDGEWNDINLSNVVSWGWPKNITVSQLLINGAVLKDDTPIHFLPSGDNSSISLQVTDGQFTTWIDSDMAGRFEVHN